MRLVGLLLVSLACFATSLKDFEGRWNLTVPNDPRGRVWWLEINGDKGRYVGAPGGDMDSISAVRVDGEELVFEMSKPRPKPDNPQAKWVGRFRANLSDGRLVGTRTDEGGQPIIFSGKRAPKLADSAKRHWKMGKPVELVAGKQVSDWDAIASPQPKNWFVKDGILSSEKGANNLISREKFWNFQLDAEFMVAKGSNGGIGLRHRYEIQIQDDYQKPVDVHTQGALYSRIAPSENACKPAGEWQTYSIRLIGRTVTVILNGKTVIDQREVEGLTAFAGDANEDQPGAITLQGDHGVVAFRKLTVTPLE
jgi:hypothetical protein